MLQNSPIYPYIPVKDMVRAREFYEEKLGFKASQEVARGVVYECGDETSFFMYPTTNAGTSKASQAYWMVKDVEREVSELKAKGVKFEEYDTPEIKTRHGIAESEGSKVAWFKDSEGNILALVQAR